MLLISSFYFIEDHFRESSPNFEITSDTIMYNTKINVAYPNGMSLIKRIKTAPKITDRTSNRVILRGEKKNCFIILLLKCVESIGDEINSTILELD